MTPAAYEGWMQLVILSTSLTYPFFLVWMRPKIGFWKGALHVLFIIVVALLSSFVVYLLWYAYYQYQRLGSEFRFFQALGWTFDESLAWFTALNVIPSVIIASVCYPMEYLASFQLFRLIRSYSESEKPTKTTGTTESRRET
jgi:hypothetical protein